jgi:hypothetical protein
MFVTAMVTLAGPLPPNSFVTVSPLDFTFSDGVQLLNVSNSGLVEGFTFITDGTGTITRWNLVVGTRFNIGLSEIATRRFLEAGGAETDYGIFDFGGPESSTASNISSPKEWRLIHVPDGGSA